MKVTLSSTSMMKPILYTQQQHGSSPTTQTAKHHPQRILGLLEPATTNPGDDLMHAYQRPDNSTPLSLVRGWHSFLRIPHANAQARVAVFGFEFDGEQTWYQVWNTQNNTLCWLLHEQDMDYQPYAILAMDALVSLLPNWDGELYLYLSPAEQTGNTCQQHKHLLNKKRGGDFDLQISDAATTSSGQLWFLVTVNNQHTFNADNNQASSGQIQTGWISQKCPVPIAA